MAVLQDTSQDQLAKALDAFVKALSERTALLRTAHRDWDPREFPQQLFKEPSQLQKAAVFTLQQELL